MDLKKTKKKKKKNDGGSSDRHYDCLSFSNLLKTVMTSDAGFQHLSSPRPKQALAIEDEMPAIVINQQNLDRLETLPTDGYGWRKYGQKQVKNSNNSRSYYRCTCCGCPAKKRVLQCDHSRRVIDVVYLGHHNHDPLQEKCCGSRGLVSTAKLPVGGLVDSLVHKSDGLDLSICSEDAGQSPLCMHESEQPGLSSSNGSFREPETREFFSASGKRTQQNSTCGLTGIEVQEKLGAETMPRKRIKESAVCASPVLKDTEESTAVIHAVVGEGNSSDGYRWRKYGEKMLKGNSYIRSYYRCTSAGCSARKQIERSADDSAVTTMKYVGEHDHDVQLPKKWRGPKVYPHVVSPVTATHKAESETTGSLSDQKSTQWSTGIEEIMDEWVLELGGEKALESARTLLSIGFEVRPG